MAAQREPWFDNIKMSLVTLVVVGHAWTLLPDERESKWLYDFLYSWHIPAFVIITGYLSKSFAYTPAKLGRLVTTVAVPYVIFEAALAWFRYEFGGVRLDELFTDPHWPMWYLSALFFWRLLTPLFNGLPAKVVIATAISLLAGLFAGDTFDIARILGLLPFFVLGLKMHEGHWNLLRTRRNRIYAVVVLLGILALSRFTDTFIETEWLYYRARYDELDPDNLRAATIRLVLLFMGLAGAYSFFALVPRVGGWFARLGSATLVVYLFHGFFVLGVKYAGFPDWAEQNQTLAFLITTIASLLIALALAWGPVSRFLNGFVDPVGTVRRARQKRRDQAPTSA